MKKGKTMARKKTRVKELTIWDVIVKAMQDQNKRKAHSKKRAKPSKSKRSKKLVTKKRKTAKRA
jgi:hypothetical protein